MSAIHRILLIVGFLLQVVGNHFARHGSVLIGGLQPLHMMIVGTVLFTIGSIQYARSKGRLWTWGLFGIILPFFLIVVLIPRRLPPEE